VRHGRRPYLDRRHPVHVTCRVVRGVKWLRGFRIYPVVRRALYEARERLGVRMIHYSIQGDHLHLLVEARGQIALGRAMKGFQVRVARRLNALAGRKGRVFADRYHARYLTTPAETRRALVYVLQNGKKHAPRDEERERSSPDWVDPYSSAPYFHGWTARCRRFMPARDAPTHPLHRGGDGPPVVPPEVWLLRAGWRRAGGLIDTAEAPAAALR
jgi:REP element-mobilizing transposase RayT